MYTIEYKGTPFLFILKHVESAVEKLVTTQITLTPSDSIEMILRAAKFFFPKSSDWPRPQTLYVDR